MSEFSGFWSRVNTGSKDDCWPWSRYVDATGYGITWFDGSNMKAHRVAFLAANGYFPEAVCHTCDNRACCNPAHLFAGTKALNNADRHTKGRSAGPRGEAHAQHKLTKNDVVEIRRMITRGMGNTEIAQSFNITHFAISDIRRNKTWRHVA